MKAQFSHPALTLIKRCPNSSPLLSAKDFPVRIIPYPDALNILLWSQCHMISDDRNDNDRHGKQTQYKDSSVNKTTREQMEFVQNHQERETIAI